MQETRRSGFGNLSNSFPKAKNRSLRFLKIWVLKLAEPDLTSQQPSQDRAVVGHRKKIFRQQLAVVSPIYEFFGLARSLGFSGMDTSLC